MLYQCTTLPVHISAGFMPYAYLIDTKQKFQISIRFGLLPGA